MTIRHARAKARIICDDDSITACVTIHRRHDITSHSNSSRSPEVYPSSMFARLAQLTSSTRKKFKNNIPKNNIFPTFHFFHKYHHPGAPLGGHISAILLPSPQTDHDDGSSTSLHELFRRENTKNIFLEKSKSILYKHNMQKLHIKTTICKNYIYIYSELTQKRISTAKTARDTQKTKTAGKFYMPDHLDILISEP